MLNETEIDRLRERIAGIRQEVLAHALYPRVRTLPALRVFMESHVFAVWDFMSLLKGLQRSLTCVETPWRPVGDAAARRLVNGIVLEEESDEIDGEPIGHFEFYLRAMEQAGADTRPIRRLLAALDAGAGLDDALARCGGPAGGRAFVAETFALIDTDKPHVIASAFTFGREDSIASMFENLTGVVYDTCAPELFVQYLERHIALDGDEHGPKALEMLARLCGDDPVRWDEATDAAERALRARAALWDSILASLPGAHANADHGDAELVAAE